LGKWQSALENAYQECTRQYAQNRENSEALRLQTSCTCRMAQAKRSLQ